MTTLNINISDVAIITIKNVDYHCIIYNISKSEALNLLKKFCSWRSRVYIKNHFLNFSLFKTIFLLLLFYYMMMMMMMMNFLGGMVDQRKAFSHFQPGPFAEILTIVRDSHRIWSSAEPEFWLSWMKLCSIEKINDSMDKMVKMDKMVDSMDIYKSLNIIIGT